MPSSNRVRRYRGKCAAIRLIGAFLLLCAAYGGDSLAAAPPPSPGNNWVRVKTAHFTLYGNAATGKIKEIGLDLEKLRATLASLIRSATVNSPVPTTVFVFKNDSAMTPYKPIYEGKPKNIAGWFQSSGDGNFIVLAANWNSDPRPVIHHEFLHYFTNSNFARFPLWYNEGLAEYYSTFLPSKNEARIGRPVEHHVRELRESGLMPLEQLFAVDQNSPEYNEASKQGIFYAQSWALVHYLHLGNPKRTPQLGRFLQLTAQGKPRDQAFRESFDTDYAGLFAELYGYVEGSKFGYVTLSLSNLHVPAETSLEPIGESDVLCQLGNLLSHSGPDRIAEAEAHFDDALAKSPAHPSAIAGLALLREDQQKEEEALELYRKAIAASPKEAWIYLRFGELLLKPLRGKSFIPGKLETGSRERLEEARRLLRKSIDLDGEFAEAHAALGESYVFEDGSAVDPGIAELEFACRRLPQRAELSVQLSTLYRRKGDHKRADELLGIARRAAGTDTSAAERETSFVQVNRFLETKRYNEALVLLETMEAAATEPEFKSLLNDHLAQVRRAASHTRSVQEFNAAIDLFNQRKLEAALAAFLRVSATAENHELAKSAADYADQITKALANKSPAKKSKHK